MKLTAQDIFALSLALALHIILGAMLWFGMPEFFKNEAPKIIPVHAVYLDQGREQAQEQKAAQAAKEKAAAEARRKAAELEARRKAEEEAKRKAAEEAKRQAADEAKRKAEQEAQQKAQAEAKRIADELARKQAAELAVKQAAEAEKKKAQELARKKAEAEKQRKIAEEKARKDALEKKQRQEANEQQLKDALEAETRAMEQARQDRTDSEIYASQLFRHIQQNWARPAGVDQEFSCKIRIHQLPGGQIQRFELLESCGNSFLDASVENAIRNSDPLPLPKNPRVFERTLDLTFKPR